MLSWRYCQSHLFTSSPARFAAHQCSRFQAVYMCDCISPVVMSKHTCVLTKFCLKWRTATALLHGINCFSTGPDKRLVAASTLVSWKLFLARKKNLRDDRKQGNYVHCVHGSRVIEDLLMWPVRHVLKKLMRKAASLHFELQN